ncbi:hypothetical protein AB5N19_06346 [Seiridium cardinale]
MAPTRTTINMINMHIPSLPLLSILTTLLALSSLASPSLAAAKPQNAILLSEVQSLTLRAGAKTAHRRTSAAPQLKCISKPNICKLHEVDLMRCTNQGSGYSTEDIQWSCTAALPSTLKLGSTDVICEGYMGPDDDYVLKGSCGVEYRLVLTEEGERKHPALANGGGWGWSDKPKPKPAGGSKEEQLDWSGIIFIIIFVAVLAWMLYSACVAGTANQTRNATRRPRNGGGGGNGGGWGPGGGGGGFGGWGNDDPPPPYPGTKPSGSSSQQGWRPGFFSGAATGAAAGYYAGSRASRQQQQRDHGSSRYGSGGSGSSWFGGGSPSSSSSNNDSSSSSARYESTGFGGTSRR